MMKIVAIVLSMSVLVASQEFMGDGLGGLLALNMLSGGRTPFNLNSLFGGAQRAQLAARTGAQGARAQRASAANPFGGLTGLLLFDAI